MCRGKTFALLRLGLICATIGVCGADDSVSWSGVLPEVVRRPQKGEAPRYPRDTVIGELGPGNAPPAAYRFARNLLAALMGNNRNSRYLQEIDKDRLEGLTAPIKPLAPRKFRVGGGKAEGDGAVSFLFRYIGREQGIAGELYLRLEEQDWLLDDIIFEDARSVTEPGEPYPYDFTPYERFF